MTERIVTVFGGSGFLGRHTVRALAKAGFRIRVAVRRPHAALFLKPMGDVGQIELIHADVTDAAQVAKALRGATHAVNLVGILAESWSRSFDTIHAEAAGHIAGAAKAAGVQHLTHVSALGASSTSPSAYARSKAQGEANLREAFPNAVILRPSVVFGPEDEFFNRFANMARYFPVLPLIGGGKTRFQPVFVGDVAQAVVSTLRDKALAGETFELGGPKIYRFSEIIALIQQVTLRRRPAMPLSFGLAKLISYAFQFLPSPLTLTPDQVELLREDNVVSAQSKGFAALSLIPAAPEAIVPAYLVRFRRTGQYLPAH
ncbi:MAG: complex I NDUFA9 subunit family protein [Alphaproteobacteria bacterium]|nr:complex I NDUFA9 subunit family protein [Alphaproteobacteria bacterium]